MTAIQLPEAVRAEILAHARDEAPNECCGLLIGRGSQIDECVRVRNVAANTAARYLVDPAEHIAINRRLRGTTRSVIGAYHSHPHAPPVPSETDCREAYYPDYIWLIVSLSDPGGALAAFTLTDRTVTRIPILDAN